MTEASTYYSLLRSAPIPPRAQRVAASLPSARRDLAKNPHLTDEAWLDLWAWATAQDGTGYYNRFSLATSLVCWE